MRLVVVLADPVAAYEAKGRGGLLRDYYNPGALFSEVYALSPREPGRRQAHGLRIESVTEADFPERLRQLRPDLVRAYGGAWTADLCARSRAADTPMVASVHNTDPALISPALRFMDRVFCVSEDVAALVRDVGVEPGRIRLLPNRIDTDVFRPRADPQRLESLERRFPPGRRILLVGRAAPQKNRDTLIRALPKLPPDYQLIAVGRGDLDGDRALAAELGVAERLHLVESVPNEDLPYWYGWADCVCNPSRFEGFGIVFIEAAASGAAIVAADLPVTRGFFEPERDAVLVSKIEDPERLARAVRRVCEDPELAARLREHAPRAAAPFSKQTVDAKEVALYREALAVAAPPTTRRLQIALWQAWHRAPLRAARRQLRAALGPARPVVAR